MPADRISPDQSVVPNLFSAAVYGELSRRGSSRLFSSLTKESGLLNSFTGSLSVAEFFDHAFSVLSDMELRPEYVFKSALIREFIAQADNSAAVAEFRVGKCRADLAIFGPSSTAIEIKSERDNLFRLEDQITAYRNVFATVEVIAGDNHIAEICRSAPQDVGVLRLSRDHRIETARPAIVSTSHASNEAVFNCVSLKEASLMLAHVGMSIPEVPNTQRHNALKNLFLEIPGDIAQAAMSAILAKTRSLPLRREIVSDLPPSLHALALSVKIRKKDRRRLLESLRTPMTEACAW